jgi:uncharacterized protein (TIGR02145 family)
MAKVFYIARMKALSALLALLCLASCSSVETSSFKDGRDGRDYKSVKIGKQIWMAENLNFNARGSSCYNNEPANCEKYGRLYNWETARAICPPGWHLPSDDEWDALIAATRRARTANFNDLDAYGFAALPGGFGDGHGQFGNIGGNNGYWWSDAEDDIHTAWVRSITLGRKAVNRGKGDKSILCSIRCVMD